jgi:hypothetical protein
MGPVASRNCAALYSIVGAWRVLFIYVAVDLTNLQRDIPLAIWVRYEYCTAYTRMLRPNAFIFTSMFSRNLERCVREAHGSELQNRRCAFLG